MVNTSDFPQADRLEQVGKVATAVGQGKYSDQDIETFLGLDSRKRQGRYYRRSAVNLGLIVNIQNNSSLTEIGREFIELKTDTDRLNFLAMRLLETELFKRALIYIHKDHPNNDELKSWHKNIYPGSPNTADRRYYSFLNYLQAAKLIKQTSGLYEILRFVGSIIKQSVSIEVGIDDGSIEYGAKRPPIVGDTRSLTFDVDLQKRERANLTHWNLVDAKSSFLNELDIKFSDNKHVDLFAKAEGDVILYEMKSINPSGTNTVSQIRKAVSQLYEYRYNFKVPNAKLCIVTNSELKGDNAWISDYLSKDRLIAYEWTENFEYFSSGNDSISLLGEFFP